jgi:hypothetical protein
MPKLVGGYTELSCSKLKKGKGFLKPNFELGPNLDLTVSKRAATAKLLICFWKIGNSPGTGRFLMSARVDLAKPNVTLMPA